MTSIKEKIDSLELDVKGNSRYTTNQRDAALDILRSLRYALGLKKDEPDDDGPMDIHRAPGVCCPDPLCDYVAFATCIEEHLICSSCGHACSHCRRL